MLWLCIALPQLPLEALRSDDTDAPLVVTACEGSARWIVCGNAAAENARLKPDMNYTVALALCPGVQKLERSPAAETAALERLGAWAYQFSSTVILGEAPTDFRHARGNALWLEIGGSLKLFGGFRNFIVALERELGLLHYSYQLGIGPTLEGAALLARGEIRVVIPSLSALQLRIRNMPLSLLGLAPEIAGALHTAGVRTIGLLLELPRDAVIKRFGVQLGNYLDRLVGAAADPRPIFHLPARYAARFDFEFEVKSTEALLFPLRRMLHEFAGFLRARDTGVQLFTITFAHRGIAGTRLDIGLSLADRDATRFLTLVREQLERFELPAPTVGISLAADQFAMPAALQADLTQSGLQQSEELAHTVDRLAARLGAQHVHGLRQVADHRPEASWTAASPQATRDHPQFPERPLWLLQEPKPLQLSVMPQMMAGPERIEGGWWDAGDVQRDYYVVHLSNGSSLWVYQDLSERGGWYLHGFWS
ncbi:MAG TPA: DNA polymerase Y family protein [Steroidobacteraceae bacterium]|nr:DNA polymerase Y family protein [Steroidobacteraceae bacterium]